MKIHFIDEEERSEFDAEWPCAPGTGDILKFRHKGGTVTYLVNRVEYDVDDTNGFVGVTVFIDM